MEHSLEALLDRFARDLRGWLEQPSEGMGKIESLQTQIEALKGTLKGNALKAMKRALREAEVGLRAQKQMIAADGITQRCRELGIRLEVGAPMKRRPKRQAKPAPEREEDGGDGVVTSGE